MVIKFEPITLEKHDSISFPERSAFYRLEIMGQGMDIESLSSYITRLCEQHSITIGGLMKYISENFYPTRRVCHGKYKVGSAINNISDSAEFFSSILEKLTTTQGLNNLTLLPFKNIINTKDLKKTINLCPICIEEMGGFGNVIYEKLVWNLVCVDMCELHECRLINQCFYCDAPLLPLCNYARIGYCAKCKKWLGRNEYSKNFAFNELEWNRFVNKNLKLLFLINQTELESYYGRNIKKIFEILTSYNISIIEISKNTNINRRTLRDWRMGKGFSLKYFLKLCYYLNVDLVDVLFSRDFNFTPHLSEVPIEIQSTNSISVKYNYEKIEEELKVILNLNPPISFKETHERLGLKYRNKALRKLFPELCKQIIIRHEEYRIEEVVKRHESIKREIYEAIELLVSEGKYPAYRKIEKKIGRPISLNQVYRNYIEHTLHELSIKPRKMRNVRPK
ncbi:TniQ family protein [Bacillus sp. OV166]|uniref:TniQ family protein n=1 Tax=Bacillus sp. OV166 TaxID=1882763 RepID=UPI000B44414F|nr:TniQ family protein [Bacillus sp. OV166]